MSTTTTGTDGLANASPTSLTVTPHCVWEHGQFRPASGGAHTEKIQPRPDGADHVYENASAFSTCQEQQKL